MTGTHGAGVGHGADARLFALDNGVFPILSEDPESWPDALETVEYQGHRPIEWRVPPWAMNSLYGRLLAAVDDAESSFYRFERSLWGSPWTTSMTRDRILDALKYFYLVGLFPEFFWHRFCRRGEAPVEAFDVISGKYD